MCLLFSFVVLFLLFQLTAPRETQEEFEHSSSLLQALSQPLLRHLSQPIGRLRPRPLDYTKDLLSAMQISTHKGHCNYRSLTDNKAYKPCQLFEHIVDLPAVNLPLAQHNCEMIELSSHKLTKQQDNVFSSSNKAYFEGLLQHANDTVFSTCAHKQQNQSNSVPRHSSRKIILTMAYTYGCRRISLFLRTLRATGTDAEVFIYTGKLEPNFCSNVISICGNVTFIQDTSFPGVKHEIRRYIQALQWLNDNIMYKLDPCSQVLIVDARDTIFQSDPFLELPNVGSQLVMIEEGYAHESLMYYHGNFSRVTIGNDNSGMNQKWMKYLLKQIFKGQTTCAKSFDFLQEKPIINSGIIIGTPLVMMKLLYYVATISSYLHLNEKYAAGQGIINFIYYFGLLKDVDVKILPPLLTPFVHLTSYIPELKKGSKHLYHPKENPYINFLKQPYAILHQVDRKHILEKIWKWQEPTWHTHHQSCTEI